MFDPLDDLSARIDDPDLDVEADDVLVLQNAHPADGSSGIRYWFLTTEAFVAQRRETADG